MMGMMSGMGVLYMLFWIVIVGLLIYGLILLILKPFEKKEEASAKEDEAMGILRERFARGEIDQLEFEERKKILQNNEK